MNTQLTDTMEHLVQVLTIVFWAVTAVIVAVLISSKE